MTQKTPKRPALPRLTKSEKLYRERLHRSLKDFDDDRFLYRKLEEHIPKEWRTLADDADIVEDKVKITLRLDKSVAAFYRAMGRGYQERINRVLGTYAQFRMSKTEETWFELAVKLQERLEQVVDGDRIDWDAQERNQALLDEWSKNL